MAIVFRTRSTSAHRSIPCAAAAAAAAAFVVLLYALITRVPGVTSKLGGQLFYVGKKHF